MPKTFDSLYFFAMLKQLKPTDEPISSINLGSFLISSEILWAVLSLPLRQVFI